MSATEPLPRLRLPVRHLRQMTDHLRAALPHEACGLLAAAAASETVTQVFPLPNIAALPNVRFEAEPLALLDALQEIERNDWRLVAIYHSHPTSEARPSPEDVRRAHYPSALSLIVSFAEAEPRYGLFAVAGGQVAERQLVIEAEPASSGETWNRLGRRLALGFVFGLLVLIALALFADVRSLPSTLATLDWRWLPGILLLTVINYALRFVKWQYYLRLVGITGLSVGDSLAIFLSGMAMAMTPGKVGELLKAYLLRRLTGTPMAVSAPIVAAERLTDGLAMLGLAAIGLIAYPLGWPALAVFFAISLVGILVAQNRPLVHRLLVWGEHLPLVSRVAHHLYVLYDSTERLLGWRPLAIAIGLGLVSWAGECLAFAAVLVALGFEATLALTLQATFILAMSTLVGAVSMLPGGLGAADVSVTGLLLLLIPGAPMTQAVAVTATLLIRFCTLWFGVLLGLVALARGGRRFLESTPGAGGRPAAGSKGNSHAAGS